MKGKNIATLSDDSNDTKMEKVKSEYTHLQQTPTIVIINITFM